MEDGLDGNPGDPARKKKDQGTETAQILLQWAKGNNVREKAHKKDFGKVHYQYF